MEKNVSCAGKILATAARARNYLGREARGRIVQFVRDKLHGDGGFKGRSCESDLYYSVFGASALLALGTAHPNPQRFEEYLRGFEPRRLDFVHLCSLVRCCNLAHYPREPGEILEHLELHRSGDGGYHHREQRAHRGTAYGCFLACQVYEDLGVPLPGEALLRCSEADVEGTPAAAAAITLFAHLDTPAPPATLAYLEARAHSGGFRAAPGAAVPDILSTATALYALSSLDLISRDEAALSSEFLDLHWDESGGFFAHALDPVPDCEYTFYGLLTLGSLCRRASAQIL